MGNVVDSASERANEYPAGTLKTRAHTFRADVNRGVGSTDSAPGPHDYFDAALAACKALTATWYAKRHDIPLERVETHVERDPTVRSDRASTGSRPGLGRLSSAR